MELNQVQIIKSEIEVNIKSCIDILKRINEVPLENKVILNWFKDLCEDIIRLITSVGTYDKESSDKLKNLDDLLLNLTQISTCLSTLIKTFVTEIKLNIIIYECRHFIKKQLIYCFERIVENLFNPTLEDPCGNFIKWMDKALDKIAEIDVDEGKTKMLECCKNARLVFEEVLSHAMSIAQVALEQDSKIIKGSSQTVLESLDGLVTEINNPTPTEAMINLFMDVCSDKLCLLERKVNAAVLKLCLKVFSDFENPLQSIEHFCFDLKNRTNAENLDSLVIDFDLHVDRIVQIGLFAVSCTSEKSRNIKIRSCLASLEGLESELVPAFNTVLLDNSAHNINYAIILRNYWLNQAIILRDYIYLIIHPFAFCQVIYEETKQIIDDLSDLIKQKVNLKQNSIEIIVKNAEVLKMFLETIMQDLNVEESTKIGVKFKNFCDVLYETKCASDLLLGGNDINFENSSRVLKRCKILLTTIKRLWFCFSDDAPIENKSINKNLRNLENQIQPTGNQFLDHIIDRGRLILKERSILYRTPKKNSSRFISEVIKSDGFLKKNSSPPAKPALLRRTFFINSSVKNETSLNLQITDILSEITNLSQTLNKVC